MTDLPDDMVEAAVRAGHAMVSKMPPTRPARNELEEQVAGMLLAIENNYYREGTGWGSRFEGERLEVVQARAVIRHVLTSPWVEVSDGG